MACAHVLAPQSLIVLFPAICTLFTQYMAKLAVAQLDVDLVSQQPAYVVPSSVEVT